MQFDREHLVGYSKQAATLLVVIVVLKFGWSFWKSTEFRMAMSDATREGATMRHGTSSISEKIAWHARELGVEMRPGDPQVEVDPRSRMVTARASYMIPVNFYATKIELKFHYATAGMPLASPADFKSPVESGESQAMPEDAGASREKPSVPNDWWKNPPGS